VITQVGWIENADCRAIVMLDVASGDSIELQRAVVVDSRDTALGMDTYCVVRGGATHYGGIESYQVANLGVTLLLSADAAAALELPELLEIIVDPEGVRILRDHLPSLLAP
jgi:hypothetical protein